nr:hypothetical protein BaRGS_020840 [Batillaria attramentaria]
MGSQVEDRTQLLESVQSDRTALSRALTQNRELKSQLAELQNGFVKLQEDEVNPIFEKRLSKKEAEVQKLQEKSQVAERQQYQQDQIQDRLRHYEAQAQLVDTLQNELTAAQDMMEALTTQNSELRTMLIKATEVKPRSENSSDSGEKSQTDDLIDSLTATIKQLEMERGQLYEHLKEQRHLSDNLSVKVADLQEEVIRKSSDYTDNDKITRSEYEQLKTAMEMIQEKYMRVMRDKAELSDKADQLEHLVVQLQGETDTIGEYISLYHHQRALLQQREQHKNEYIAQLASDREHLQDKLGELQALVMQLLGERNMLHSYHEESASQMLTHNATSASIGVAQDDDPTAHRILNLLSEIGHSNLVKQVSFRTGTFYPVNTVKGPCKSCSGPV